MLPFNHYYCDYHYYHYDAALLSLWIDCFLRLLRVRAINLDEILEMTDVHPQKRWRLKERIAACATGSDEDKERAAKAQAHLDSADIADQLSEYVMVIACLLYTSPSPRD